MNQTYFLITLIFMQQVLFYLTLFKNQMHLLKILTLNQYSFYDHLI